MSILRKPRWSRLFGFMCAAAVALPAPGIAATPPEAAPPARAADADPAETLLRALHPDYLSFVSAVRAMDEAESARAPVYMVLVRPGAADATRRESAPLAGPGARNDILYDPGVFSGTRSVGWRLLLLDHEYFHARHLAGATGLPLPLRAGSAVERHFFEAAAWGYTVAAARADRYPGLREEEFREALDRYGEHYRALRELTRDDRPALWSALDDPLRGDLAVRTAGSPLPAVPWHPSGPGRSPATP